MNKAAIYQRYLAHSRAVEAAKQHAEKPEEKKVEETTEKTLADIIAENSPAIEQELDEYFDKFVDVRDIAKGDEANYELNDSVTLCPQVTCEPNVAIPDPVVPDPQPSASTLLESIDKQLTGTKKKNKKRR